MDLVDKDFFDPPPSANFIATAAQAVDAESTINRPPERHAVALYLAFHGWKGDKDISVPHLRCEHCFSRIACWMYSNERIQEMSAKLHIDPSDLRLWPMKSHYTYCPWKNPVSQYNPSTSSTTGLNAYQTLLSTMKRTKISYSERLKWQEEERRARLARPFHAGANEDGTESGRRSGEAAPNTYEEVPCNSDVPVDFEQLKQARLAEEKQDKEIATRWKKLKSRMSFRRPKSSSGKSISGKSIVSTSENVDAVYLQSSRPETPTPTDSNP
jgi:hypothetical protein